MTATQVQHRANDLESLGYMLIYFLRGRLPWDHPKAHYRSQKNQVVMNMKLNTKLQDLCEDLPPEFIAYFRHINSLEFDQDPQYSYLRKLFLVLFIRLGFEYDNVYDWTILWYAMDMQRNKAKEEEAQPPADIQSDYFEASSADERESKCICVRTKLSSSAMEG